MLLVGAILLAIFVLDSPWEVVVVAVAAAAEVAESVWWLRWSQRRRAKVGAETLIGAQAKVTQRLDPVGQVQVQGELWQARATQAEPIEPGAKVRVLALQDLTLIVEPAD